jgi:phage terminase large subunit-like protein
MMYANQVLDGTIVACKWVRLACRRHVDDLAHGHERGIWFDEGAAKHAIDFFRFCRHSKGEWAGQTIHLEPWQQFVAWSVFGWMSADEDTGEAVRRFRTAWVEVARKNGKSTFAAALGLYMLDADGEPGAEIYSAATKKDQAKITFDEASRMVKSSPSLRKRIRPFRDNLHIPGTASKFMPLGRDADSLDGLNTHCAIIDEVHAHRNRETWDVMETSTGSRRQPLMVGITTAGVGIHTLWGNLREYAEKVLDRIIDDDRFFAIIYTLDPAIKDGEGNEIQPGDDWEDERCWIKANPNLGISKKWSTLRDKAAAAKEMPAALNSFLRRELNVSTDAVSRWVSPETWAACGGAVNSDGLAGRTCYIGLDLSQTTDITACVLVFPPVEAGDPYQVLCHFYLPQESMGQRVKRDRVPYDVWVRSGFITTTPGNVIDYDFIVADIDDLMTRYDVAEIAYDPWGATQIQTQLAELRDGDDWLIQFRQGFASMSPAMKALERLYLAGELAHGNNPVLNWMASNLVVREDPAGNTKPDKAKSTERIDGMVALAMAVDRAVRRQGAEPSVYEERGIRVL